MIIYRDCVSAPLIHISRVKFIGKSHHEWPKSLFTVTNILFYFLHAIFCPEYTFPLKQPPIAHCAIVAMDGFFWLNIDVHTVDMWRQVNAEHWYCGVIFVDCSWACKLAQRRSSLVNSNREYRFLSTRYSRLSVWEHGGLALSQRNTDVHHTCVIPLMLATRNSACVSLWSLTSQAGRSRSGSIEWQARKPVVLARRSRQASGTTREKGSAEKWTNPQLHKRYQYFCSKQIALRP